MPGKVVCLDTYKRLRRAQEILDNITIRIFLEGSISSANVKGVLYFPGESNNGENNFET